MGIVQVFRASGWAFNPDDLAGLPFDNAHVSGRCLSLIDESEAHRGAVVTHVTESTNQDFRREWPFSGNDPTAYLNFTDGQVSFAGLSQPDLGLKSGVATTSSKLSMMSVADKGLAVAAQDVVVGAVVGRIGTKWLNSSRSKRNLAKIADGEERMRNSDHHGYVVFHYSWLDVWQFSLQPSKFGGSLVSLMGSYANGAAWEVQFRTSQALSPDTFRFALHRFVSAHVVFNRMLVKDGREIEGYEPEESLARAEAALQQLDACKDEFESSGTYRVRGFKGTRTEALPSSPPEQ